MSSDPTRAASQQDAVLAVRYILERMEQDQNERRQWHTESMIAYDKRGDGISGLMTAWLVTRTVVELAIFIVLVLIYNQY